MCGIKATALAAHCRRLERPFLRFDYFGHGASSGVFRDGSIGRWLEDALAVIDQLTEGPQILVGSSYGRLDRAARRASPSPAHSRAHRHRAGAGFH
jgi:pimeloyl-ACP methyl ester carboxylesterase